MACSQSDAYTGLRLRSLLQALMLPALENLFLEDEKDGTMLEETL
jgi:hypothetical protein